MTGLRDTPDVYNIAAGRPFADTLAQGVLERAGGDPLLLSDYTILLPSRRACRTLREAFLRLSGGNATLLPALHPIGDVNADEVELLLAGAGDAAESLEIPPAVSKLERQLLLARAIQSKNGELSFDRAAALAAELGRFLDEVQTEGRSFEGLAQLVPEEFARHWQETLEFLKILTEHWPGILEERSVIDFAARRNLLLGAQVKAWESRPPQKPVIAAGSTGTVPAAAELLKLVACLPQGALVLPGLDAGMDEESWAALGEDHPQYGMKRLLARLGIGRGAVREWEVRKPAPANLARARLLSEALRPAATTEKWRGLRGGGIAAQALDGFTRIDCDTPQEEADVIALIMREALETPSKTCALITPDRRLARRVALGLRRWNIHIDDSGGQPLTELSVGTWLMLTAEVAEEGLAPVTLLSFLKHPFMAAGMQPGELRAMVGLLDAHALRGPRPTPGFEGLRAAVTRTKNERLIAWLGRLEKQMWEFTGLMASAAEMPFHEILRCHIRAAETLAAADGVSGAERLWRGEAGEAAGALFNDLLAHAGDIPPLTPEHYVSLLGTLLKSVTVRPRFGAHPRLSILGQIEARLYCADLVILGGLNEGSWPELPAHDPWMSRPMRRKFELPAPEKSIGLAAHDFVQAAAAREAIVTRARRVDGTPTVPARWLLRLEAVLQAAGLDWVSAPAEKYRRWARQMDDAGAPSPVSRPAPAPPVEARPRKLSVTRIESWMRDPYQIYAEYILDLDALDPLHADPGGAERGIFIHAALEDFIREYPEQLPAGAEARLLDLGRAALAEMRIPQEVEAFWWPRFEKIARLFVEQEREWRARARPCLTEAKGRWQFDSAAGPFTLTATADRIDRLHDGSYAVIDYKSGTIPKIAEVRAGLSPQLPLEAFILEKGGFEGIPAAAVQEMSYWKVTGSGQKPVDRIVVEPERGQSVKDMIVEAEARLKELVGRFDDPATPYLCRPRAEAVPRFSDYDHLARVKEWGVAGDEAEGAA